MNFGMKSWQICSVLNLKLWTATLCVVFNGLAFHSHSRWPQHPWLVHVHHHWHILTILIMGVLKQWNWKSLQIMRPIGFSYSTTLHSKVNTFTGKHQYRKPSLSKPAVATCVSRTLFTPTYLQRLEFFFLAFQRFV